MKRSVFISIVICSLSLASGPINVLLYNFNNYTIDNNNEIAVKIHDQMMHTFVDVMKSDMSFLDDINFIPTKRLEKQRTKTNSNLLDHISRHLKNNVAQFISEDKIRDILNSASDYNLSTKQIDVLIDSISTSSYLVTRDVTQRLMDINETTQGESGQIKTRDLYDYIKSSTSKTLNQSTVSSLISSANPDFNSDIIAVGKYSIMEGEIIVTIYLYKFSDFSFMGEVQARSAISQGHILIKDIEYKLLDKLEVVLDDNQKASLSEFSVENFNKKYNYHYFSKLFHTSDIKEIKYRMQFSDEFRLTEYYYKSLFSGLMEQNIDYSIKLYNNDMFYRVFSTDLVEDISVYLNTLNSAWHSKMGVHTTASFTEKSNPSNRNSRSLFKVDYDEIESIYFRESSGNFIDLVKQISIYGLAIGFVFGLTLMM